MTAGQVAVPMVLRTPFGSGTGAAAQHSQSLEAMYLKKLCVVSNVVGSRDVINNGENGYICDSAAAFVNAINHYKDEESKAIREQAHQDIVEHYSLEQMLKKYDSLYSKKIYAK